MQLWRRFDVNININWSCSRKIIPWGQEEYLTFLLYNCFTFNAGTLQQPKLWYVILKQNSFVYCNAYRDEDSKSCCFSISLNEETKKQQLAVSSFVEMAFRGKRLEWCIKLLMVFIRTAVFQHSHKEWKDSLEIRAVLLIFSLELEMSGMVVQRIHQNSEKWSLLWGIAQWKWR